MDKVVTPPPAPAAVARALLAGARKAALGTRAPADGAPYVSLVLVADDGGGRPLFLLSRLARHTAHLPATPVASLLVDGTDAAGDPMAGGRVTFQGPVEKLGRDTDAGIAARRAFLARHPSAHVYAEFEDFDIYRMRVDSAHLIQGFGRIVDIDGRDLA